MLPLDFEIGWYYEVVLKEIENKEAEMISLINPLSSMKLPLGEPKKRNLKVSNICQQTLQNYFERCCQSFE